MEEVQEKKKKPRKAFRTIKDIFQGELLLRMGVEKYLAHLVVIAIAMAGVMLTRSFVESTQIKRERMKAEVKEAKIRHSQKTIEFVGMGKMSTGEELLEQNDVKVYKPSKPAQIIEK